MADSDMYSLAGPCSAVSRRVCCRCSRVVAGHADQQLLPVPVCARHYVCRSCYVSAMSYCPGCVVADGGAADSQRTTATAGWGTHGRLVTARLNGGPTSSLTRRATETDSNGNGGATRATPGSGAGTVSPPDVCLVCGRVTEPAAASDASTPAVCQSCCKSHQLHDVLPALRLHHDIVTTTSQQQLVDLTRGPSSEYQQLVTSTSSLLRAVVPAAPGGTAGIGTVDGSVTPSLSTVHSQSCSEQGALSALLGGLMIHSSSDISTTAVLPAASATGLLAPGLHDAANRQRRLDVLETPISRQSEGWLWQALNNGGFELASRNIDERKQQIGVNLQSTLREMEFRLERCRGVLDELYRESMRQAIDVSRSQMEALQTQSERLQRARAAAARLQHARLYNDKTRAQCAELDLQHCLRENASSTCLRACDDGWIEFRSPSDDELRAYLRSACTVDCRVHPPLCTVTCHDRHVNCLSWTLVGRLSEFDIQLRNHCHAGVDDGALTVLISDPRGAELIYEYQRRSAGHYVVRFRPALTGTHRVYVLLRDRHLADSPYKVGVTDRLCYRLSDCPTPWTTLSTVVSLSSYNLVKPWGVCWAPAAPDSSERFLVADRDAHSILVFDRNGSFVARRTSSFRRPTHVAVTSRGHVVITDKDNHRVQVLTSSWAHVRTFGTEGDRDGQFRYPWEVAVNSADEILVSDSKNYRVQLFTSAGQFLAKHCLERASREEKDGPRGVAFARNDLAAVADFDMLRVLVLSPDLRSVVHVIGVPGLSGAPRSPADLRTKGCIERPRGLAFDAHDNLLVVQARTNRETNSLVKFSLTGDCQLMEFQKDACGICVCPDGRIAVVHPQSGVIVYTEL